MSLNTPNTYSAGAKQTMAPSATTAGFSLTPGALPSNASAGDVAVDANAGNVLKTFNGAAWVAAAGGGAYASSFTAQTSVTIPGAAHQLNTPNLVVNCYDTETPAMEVDPDTVSVNLTTYDVTINFAQPQSGRCVVSSGGAGNPAPTVLTASGNLSFPAIGAGTCAADQTLAMPGAAPGDMVAPAWPANLSTGLMGTMWVSASGTLSVRLCNLSAVTVNAASNTYSAADVRSF